MSVVPIFLALLLYKKACHKHSFQTTASENNEVPPPPLGLQKAAGRKGRKGEGIVLPGRKKWGEISEKRPFPNFGKYLVDDKQRTDKPRELLCFISNCVSALTQHLFRVCFPPHLQREMSIAAHSASAIVACSCAERGMGYSLHIFQWNKGVFGGRFVERPSQTQRL